MILGDVSKLFRRELECAAFDSGEEMGDEDFSRLSVETEIRPSIDKIDSEIVRCTYHAVGIHPETLDFVFREGWELGREILMFLEPQQGFGVRADSVLQEVQNSYPSNYDSTYLELGNERFAGCFQGLNRRRRWCCGGALSGGFGWRRSRSRRGFPRIPVGTRFLRSAPLATQRKR